MRAFAAVTGAYWAFTVTDGALRMLVLLHFHELGYGPVTLAFLFLLYEVLGVATNFVGGRLGSRVGLNRTLYAGLSIQVVALLLLSLQNPDWAEAASVVFVMSTQALSGVAKDLTKLSAKSAVKVVAPADEAGSTLFRWVAILTGSKNALKGVGFFVGGALLSTVGFANGLRLMAVVLVVVLLAVTVSLRVDIGRSKSPAPFGSLLSTSGAINRLAGARVFLFAARDLWFVVALPVFLTEELGWSFSATGGFLAAWVIGYGMVQSLAPRLLARGRGREASLAAQWSAVLASVAGLMTAALVVGLPATPVVIGGLVVFGLAFAVASAVHSFLILAYADEDVASEVGFYYSANAVGRLLGTLLSGVTYLVGGLEVSLLLATGFLVISWVVSRRLPPLSVGQAGTSLRC